MDCTEINIMSMFFVLENFSLIWRLHHCWRISTNVELDLNSTPIAIEQWGFLRGKRHTFFWSSPRSNNGRTCCLALGSGTVTLRVFWSPDRDSNTGLPISMANVITIDPPQDLIRGQWSINFDYCKIFLKSSFSKPPRSIFI